MRKYRGLVFRFALMVLCASLAVGMATVRVFAIGTTGKITIQPQYGGKNVAAASSFSLYQVATVKNLSPLTFALNADFAESGIDVNGFQTAEEIRKLAEVFYRLAKGTPTVKTKGGETDEVELGIYLVVNTAIDRDYNTALPFLLFVPNEFQNGNWVTEFTAYPKVEQNSPNSTPSRPHRPQRPDKPQSTYEANPPAKTGTYEAKPPAKTVSLPELPPIPGIQTGILQWPVPVLSILGIILIVRGTTVVREKKRYENKERQT